MGDFCLANGFLFKGNMLCIPHTSLEKVLTKELYGGGLASHFGRDKTLEIMSCKISNEQSQNTILHQPWLIPRSIWEDLPWTSSWVSLECNEIINW